nr:unnamed protein product [Digitaria exilis]
MVSDHDPTEAANKVIAMYLRCLTGIRPCWLPWAEYIYNTAYQSALKEMPFKIVYGRDPPTIRSYEEGETRVAALAKGMAERDELLADVRYGLEQAQAVYKHHYDKHHRDVSFAVDDWVWEAPASLPALTRGKLQPRYYGPYCVLAVINDVAYRLELPAGARLHDVFHVGLLKKYVGLPPDVPPALPPTSNGAAVLEPEKAVCARLARGVRQVLVQWKGESPASATWEDIDTFIQRYPAFQLEDKLLLEGGRDVMWGRTYERRRRRVQGKLPALLLPPATSYAAGDLLSWIVRPLTGA